MSTRNKILLAVGAVMLVIAAVAVNYSWPATEFEQPQSADLYSEPEEHDKSDCELIDNKNCYEPDFVHRKAVVEDNKAKRVEQVNISVKRTDSNVDHRDPEGSLESDSGYEFYVERLAFEEDSSAVLGIQFQYDVVMGRLTKILSLDKEPAKDDKISFIGPPQEKDEDFLKSPCTKNSDV